MRIIVGSKNVAKVGSVQQAAAGYWPDAVVEGFEAESGVSNQPIGEEETMTGALNRARAAQAKGCDLGVGIEGGVSVVHGQWVMMSFIAVTDGTREIVLPVTGTPLPHHWGEALKNGAELRPLVIESGLEYDYKLGVNGILTKGAVARDEVFRVAMQNALAPWVNPQAYAA